MDLDKKNIIFLVIFFALLVFAILVGYSINSNKNSSKTKPVVIEEDEIDVEKNDLSNKDYVQELFKVYSRLETRDEARYLPNLSSDANYQYDLSYETKMYLAYSRLSAADRIKINCSQVEVSIPSTLYCVDSTYFVDRGTLTESYVYLFGMTEELPEKDFLTFVYDGNSKYIYFIPKNQTEYQMPRAEMDSAYLEGGKLIINYHLDFSHMNSSNNKATSIKLTFSKETKDHYIFESKTVSYG